MNRIITKIKDIKLNRINNLLNFPNSSYAILKGTVKNGLAVAGGAIAAYAIYNNSAALIAKSSLLSEYTMEIKEYYGVEGLSLGAGLLGYGLTSYVGTEVAKKIMEQRNSLRSIFDITSKNKIMELSGFILNKGISIMKDSIKRAREIFQLAYEWRITTSMLVMFTLSLYVDPQNSIEVASWISENFESLLKIYDVFNKGFVHIFSFFGPILYLAWYMTERMNGTVHYGIDLMMFFVKQRYSALAHMVSVLTAFGLIGAISYDALDGDVEMFDGLYEMGCELINIEAV